MVAAAHPPDRESEHSTLDKVSDTIEEVGERVAETVEQLKPRLRGWIHAVTFPLTVAMGIVLVVMAPPVAGKVACGIFALTACLLFGTSAVYHRGTWSERTGAALRRADHSNIFLIIAGTYTPLAVLLLPPRTATTLLAVVWGGALLGLLARVVWLNAPRWVYVPIYLALGWVAVGYMGQFWAAGGPVIVWLVGAGGLAYTVGAVIYGIKRPNPSPRWFGFHEIFHALTVVGFACHTVAIFIAAATR